MDRIFLATTEIHDWMRFVNNPMMRWMRGRSACEGAVSWEDASRATANGLPQEVSAALDTQNALTAADLLVALPQHRVPLDTQRSVSQCTVWAFLRTQGGHVSMVVEAKVRERFGSSIGQWLTQQSEAKTTRLGFLMDTL
ncbi:DUF6946 family protein, partial [Candidatus Latescibacterota bacterium]